MSETEVKQPEPVSCLGCIGPIVLCLCGIGVVAFFLYSSQKNNQFVPPVPLNTLPFPIAPAPAPVIPDLPEIISELRRGKSAAESRAAAATSNLSKKRFATKREQAAFNEGRRRYNSAKEETDGCITYIQTSISRRLTLEDAPKIDGRVRASRAKINNLLGWTNVYETSFKDYIPDISIVQSIVDWLANNGQQNEQAIDRIVNALEGCRMLDWEKLPR